MNKVIIFNKVGYDPFIDFIKAYAIMCVLIGHAMVMHDYWGYGLWAGMQVPLFVLVQIFHSFKKETPHINIKKIFLRVILPYIIIQCIVLIFLLCKNSSGLFSFIEGGGAGPGSYYPWVYIQIALLLPFAKKWIDKNREHPTKVLLSFLCICEAFEMLFSVIDMSDRIYRLLAVRYIFLLYLAWIWIKTGIVINRLTTILSVLSFIAIVYFEYFSVDDEILFYKTAWKFHRWPCYFFVANGGVYLLRLLFDFLQNNPFIMKIISLLAKCSYEIFLIQMFVLYVYPDSFINELQIIKDIDHRLIAVLIQSILKMIIVFTLSIYLGYYFNLYYNRIINKV